MKIGTSYYPEDISECEWLTDLQNMRAAGLSLVRIGEFAWASIEPREGAYDFAWLDRFVTLAHKLEFGIVLCTPTATPPAWLTTQYPEMMVELRDGTRGGPGGRRDADVESDIYRHYCVEICTALGKRYGSHPAVVGWQIDNELIGPEGVPPECHTPAARFRFRQYLKRVHGDLDTLNDRWGTTFWSQRYSDWGEIQTPRHPRSTMGQVLDYSRYFSESIKRFIVLQRDALRAVIAKEQWISTNSTAVFDRGLDHADWASELDVCGWDAYTGAAGGHKSDAAAALAHDMFRSAKHKPFWIFETNAVDPRTTRAFWGEMRARGAEAIIFWHWRAHRANAECQSDTLCDHAGRPYAERVAWLKALTSRPELAIPLPPKLPRRRAAILFCPDCVRTSLTPDPYIQRGLVSRVPYLRVLTETYAIARAQGIDLDVVRPGQSLDGYDLLLMPSAQLLGSDAATQVRQFVERGGSLVAVAKTAHQDEWAKFYRSPGEPLAEVLGFTVRRDIRSGAPVRVRLDNGEMLESEAHLEQIDQVSPSSRVHARFEDGPAAGAAAALTHRFGKGQVEYVACLCPVLIDRAISRGVSAAGMAAKRSSAPAVRLAALDGGGEWIINHGAEPVAVDGSTIAAGDFVRR